MAKSPRLTPVVPQAPQSPDLMSQLGLSPIDMAAQLFGLVAVLDGLGHHKPDADIEDAFDNMPI